MSICLTRLNGVDQALTKAEYGGVSVRSVLSLLLYSHHNGLRVTCQAFSVLLSEGVNTFFRLTVLCECLVIVTVWFWVAAYMCTDL